MCTYLKHLSDGYSLYCFLAPYQVFSWATSLCTLGISRYLAEKPMFLPSLLPFVHHPFPFFLSGFCQVQDQRGWSLEVSGQQVGAWSCKFGSTWNYKVRVVEGGFGTRSCFLPRGSLRTLESGPRWEPSALFYYQCRWGCPSSPEATIPLGIPHPFEWMERFFSLHSSFFVLVHFQDTWNKYWWMLGFKF